MGDWHKTPLRVRYQETDKMGIVYHANYLVWFEVGRTDLIRATGIKYSDVEEKGFLLPVINVECHYKTPARYDDDVIVKTRVARSNGVRLDFEYEIVRAKDDELLAYGKTFHAWVDKEMQPVNMKKKFPELILKLGGQ